MTDNTFESLFESLDETELQTLVNAGVNVDASATHSEKKRLYHLTKKDTEPVRRLPKGRTVKTVLLAAALLTAFVLVAGAVAHFILPATIPEHIEGFTLQAVDPVVIEQDGKSVPVTATSRPRPERAWATGLSQAEKSMRPASFLQAKKEKLRLPRSW